MTKTRYIFALLLLSLGSIGAQGQENTAIPTVFESSLERHLWEVGQSDPVKLFQAVDPVSTIQSDKWENLRAELQQKRQKTTNDYKFVRSIFQKTHKYLLKDYQQHATFNAMLEKGAFDCVSGSAALGLLLDEFGIDYAIVETDYHVFITVHLDGKDLILESTLPIGGLIYKASDVQAYLNSYKPKENAKLSSISTRIGSVETAIEDNSIFRKVNLTQLAGLLYYNDGIYEFNSQKYGVAADQLRKAYQLYPSDRIAGLKELSEDLASGKKLLAGTN